MTNESHLWFFIQDTPQKLTSRARVKALGLTRALSNLMRRASKTVLKDLSHWPLVELTNPRPEVTSLNLADYGVPSVRAQAPRQASVMATDSDPLFLFDTAQKLTSRARVKALGLDSSPEQSHETCFKNCAQGFESLALGWAHKPSP